MSGRQTTRVWKLVQSWLDDQPFRVSQSQLAERIGVQRSALSQWKYGQTTPTPAHLRALSRVTRIYYSELTHALLVDLGYIEWDDDEGSGGDGNASSSTSAGGSRGHGTMLTGGADKPKAVGDLQGRRKAKKGE